MVCAAATIEPASFSATLTLRRGCGVIIRCDRSGHGVAIRQELRFLRQQLPEILAKRIDVLSLRMIRIIEDLSGDWRRLDERIQHVTEEIEALAHGSESCRQLMTVPSVGPIIASAMVAAIANGAAFTKGRDSSDWCRSRCRPAIARSLGASVSAAIATCGCY
jgi:transposase